MAQVVSSSQLPSVRCAATSARQQRSIAARPFGVRAAFSASAQKVQRFNSTIVKAAASMVGESEMPTDYALYETMIVLRPDMSDEQRDVELAKFEAFLSKQNVQGINVTIRGKQRLAYPIKKFFEGVYVLYTYTAASDVSQKVQKMLSTPEAGAELNILRHMSFRL